MKEPLGVFFEQYLDTGSLFKDKTVFQPNFVPEEVTHRDAQINLIAHIMAPVLRSHRASNVFVYGKTGTGKTLSIHHVTSNLQHVAKQRKLPVTVISVNCKLRRVADTEYRLIAELARQMDYDVPATGLPTEEVYASFVHALESRGHMAIIVLDEIDHLVAKSGNGILYNLTRLNSQMSKAQISIIGISNDIMFTDHLDPRIKSSLSEEEVVFPPYNALQIKHILEQRAKAAFQEGSLEAGVLEKCAAFAAREHGDARRAIELLRIAGELAERQQSKVVTLAHMDQAKDQIEHDRIEEVVASQPKQYQALLLSILHLDIRRKGMLFTGEVYELYTRMCVRAGLRPLTQRRVSDIIGEFDLLGIINAKIVSKGRYGRMREIQLSLAPSTRNQIKAILEKALDLESGNQADTS